MERWETIKEHPNYEISTYVRVRKKENGKIIKPNRDLKHERVFVDGRYRYADRLFIDTFGLGF